ncbi:MAG: ABC transporter ATP-binding protein [Oscillospiraceae bacterium]|nr:ABC transporter ATP-binding protein [Oscillospiraceae bacterium]MCI9669735.1 ABC transporter ATP-binding protein [Oscillospiraceae bacterium]RKJ53574.1 ABC transporter ATP-binding protein [bacterium 1XD42-8]RKJ62981.1 ABC transporter ATP-binding protein [bacterium 1XD42-1]
MLELKNISKTFFPGTQNERKALENIQLHLKKGDFVTIIGGNGAGKSTLFNVIAGSLQPDQGGIFLDGKNITFLPDYKRARRIGRLFQDPLRGTAPNMTIEENLALAYMRGSRHKFSIGISKKEIALFQEHLARLGLGLENRMKMKMGLLSGGQRQAVTLLMATIVTPQLLLLDEHTAALDPATANQVAALTQQIVAEHQITTMMITHNMKQSLSCGNRTIMMDEGRIILDISGQERAGKTVKDLLEMFQTKQKKEFDNDRILLSDDGAA